MFEQNIFRVKAGIADGLQGLKMLKNFAGRLQQYECVAKLRDIEICLLSAASQLDYCQYPGLNKGLTPKGKLFYNQLFNYCIIGDWEQIPANFLELLQERKDRLNKQMAFDDNSSGKLINLNAQLTTTENQLRGFIGFMHPAAFLPGIKHEPTNAQNGSIILKCYTQTNYYEFLKRSFRHDNPFYQMQIDLSALAASLPLFYNEEQPPADILETLPLKFRNEKICLLFSVLARDGLLAWEDF